MKNMEKSMPSVTQNPRTLESRYASLFRIDANIYEVKLQFIGEDRETTIILPPPLAREVAQSLWNVATAYEEKFGMPKLAPEPEPPETGVPSRGGPVPRLVAEAVAAQDKGSAPAPPVNSAPAPGLDGTTRPAGG